LDYNHRSPKLIDWATGRDTRARNLPTIAILIIEVRQYESSD